MTEMEKEIETLDLRQKVTDFAECCLAMYSFAYWYGFTKEEVKEMGILHMKIPFDDGEIDLIKNSLETLDIVYEKNDNTFSSEVLKNLYREKYFNGETEMSKLYEKHMGETAKVAVERIRSKE